MSMLSAQCDELRTLADELRQIYEHNTDWLRMEAVTLASSVDAMRKAADTIESLRERLQDATLGSGTCEMVPSFTEPRTMGDCQEFCCSKCGEYMVIQQFPGAVEEVPNYCQHCGAANVKAVER